nr:hypothetical protein [Kibdelosporangium sp. MJ126-NF4]CTQ95406.1 hypothetical protein [Kibdelosporangium sp. MJ126-NF4]
MDERGDLMRLARPLRSLWIGSQSLWERPTYDTLGKRELSPAGQVSSREYVPN